MAINKIPKHWRLRPHWLREQAEEAFVFNKELGCHQVRAPDILAHVRPARTICSAFEQSAAWAAADDRLSGNLLFDLWPNLQEDTRASISDFFAAQALTDFAFFDYGGRALAFRAHDGNTGHTRIVPYRSGSHRALHPPRAPRRATRAGDQRRQRGAI